jgi:hypothetical protein
VSERKPLRAGNDRTREPVDTVNFPVDTGEQSLPAAADCDPLCSSGILVCGVISSAQLSIRRTI